MCVCAQDCWCQNPSVRSCNDSEYVSSVFIAFHTYATCRSYIICNLSMWSLWSIVIIIFQYQLLLQYILHRIRRSRFFRPPSAAPSAYAGDASWGRHPALFVLSWRGLEGHKAGQILGLENDIHPTVPVNHPSFLMKSKMGFIYRGGQRIKNGKKHQ